MSGVVEFSRRDSVAILAATGKDAALTHALLRRASIESFICTAVAEICSAIRETSGALLLTEESLENGGLAAVFQELSQQEPWSDLPILLLTHHGANSSIASRSVQLLGNVTLLERPVRPATLLSSVRTALKARARQYQVQEHLAARARTEVALRDADRRKDEFLATLAHELRNPLAPLRNALSILRLKSGKEPATEQVCDIMERQTDQLVRLVDDLMEVSRITRGKVELQTKPIDIATVISSAVEASQPLIDAASPELTVSLPPASLLVRGDPARLSQVFSNLLNNAAKYMNAGGQIFVDARREGPAVVVTVRDAGIGIEPDMLPHIFEMFTQADRSKRQAQGGLGIGLTLVHQLVAMHGGEVEARSAGLDQGCEFLVRLPLASPECEYETAESSSVGTTLPQVPRQRVLVVDDNRDAAETLRKLLQLLGVEAHAVNDGASALQLLSEYRPSVILLDIGMPGMDGFEVARRIREDPAGIDTLLVALTGWGQPTDRHRTEQAGFDHHLLKPASIDSLASILLPLSPASP